MLIEEVINEFKRTHLQHIEDIILTDGHLGGQGVIDYFQGILQTLQGSADQPINVSVKWDGAPAIVCGLNPENGKWFVYDGDMMTEYLGEQECYYTDKKVAQSLLAVRLYNLSVKLWDDVKTNN